MYGCAGGHEDVVRVLLDAGANVEDHNENGHTPLMEAASAGHVQVAKILLEHGAGINTHSNEFKESALTLACYKGHLEMVRFLLEAGADQVRLFYLLPKTIIKTFNHSMQISMNIISRCCNILF
jgi:ankyrin repeat domain-containing protein 17